MRETAQLVILVLKLVDEPLLKYLTSCKIASSLSYDVEQMFKYFEIYIYIYNTCNYDEGLPPTSEGIW